MRVLAIEPYYGGSHQAFLEQLVAHSCHQWQCVTLPARHWKWRMRSAPAELLNRLAESLDGQPLPDVVWGSDMLDLPTWLGLAIKDSRIDNGLLNRPLVMYFHENQWAYPPAPDSRVDHHFAFTNLLSAQAADHCWFNSRYNRDSLLERAQAFVKRMPDSRHSIDLQAVEQKSVIMPPGFTMPSLTVPSFTLSDTPMHQTAASSDQPITIGWVARWEHDKRPDRFQQLLGLLTKAEIDFQLILMGQRGKTAEWVDPIEQQYRAQILFNGYASSEADYWRWLHQMDVVVSTADHEFYGIAIRQAIWAGAVPVTPNALSYPEFVPDTLCYGSLSEAAEIINRLQSTNERQSFAQQALAAIENETIESVTHRMDRELERIAK